MEKDSQKKSEQETSSLTDKNTVLFSWKAPVRPFKKRDRQFFTTVVAIGFLLSLILFFIEGALPVAVIIALVFLVYVLSTVPPEEVEHKITNKGVEFAGKLYRWEELVRFWFTHRFGNELLIIETFRMPGRIELVIDQGKRGEIRKSLEKHVPYEEAAPNFLDRAASWLGKRVSLST